MTGKATQQNFLLFALYVAIWVIWRLLINISIDEKLGYYEYDALTVIFLIEISKLAISLFFVLSAPQPQKSLRKALSWWKIGIYFMIPALIYVVNNVLTFYNLSHFDPLSYRVLLNTRVLFSGLLFQILLQQHLSQHKWAGLVLLFAACVTIQWTAGDFILFATQPTYILSILMQAFAGSCGDAYSELLLKTEGTESIHVKNSYLFSFTSAITLIFILITKADVFAAGEVFFGGYSGVTWLIILFGIFCGLSTSMVLYKLNIIFKEYGIGIQMNVIAFGSMMTFGGFALNNLLAFLLLSASLYLYFATSFQQRKLSPQSPKMLDEII